jgi:hypothetical protein
MRWPIYSTALIGVSWLFYIGLRVKREVVMDGVSVAFINQVYDNLKLLVILCKSITFPF